eukprot:maker-scaffold_30-snap-gene-2.66-mRNA-1 protein AED:0.42 eAED:0.42 QI:126/1/0.5/1/1/1/2/0/859
METISSPESQQLLAVVLPGIVATVAYTKSWLTLPGSLTGFVLATIICSVDLFFALPLVSFFLIGTLATKLSLKLQKNTQEKIVSYEEDVKKGRSAWQVLATALVPTLVAALSSVLPTFPLNSLSEILNRNVIIQIRKFYFSFFACDLADTLASEFGVLSSERPLLLKTLQPVPRGTDGAISLTGTLWSIIGGTIIGVLAAINSAESGLDFGLITLKYSIVGFIGSLLDSALGCLLQSPEVLAVSPESWKTRNTLVNFLSGCLTLFVELSFQVWFPESTYIGIAIMIVTGLILSPFSSKINRKLLHLSVAGLVVLAACYNMEIFIERIALIISFLSLPQIKLGHVWKKFAKEPKKKEFDSGIFLFAFTTGISFYYLKKDAALKVLIPMYFSDPIASLAGMYLSKEKRAQKSLSNKSIPGSFAFFLSCAFLLYSTELITDPIFVVVLSANISLVELLSGSLDNFTIVMIMIQLSVTQDDMKRGFSNFSFSVIIICGLLAHFVLFGYKLSELKTAISAFRWFTRPHTVVGTSLSLFVVSFITFFSNMPSDELSNPKVQSQLKSSFLAMWISALQANIYIVGLNQVVDAEIDKVNKPYLPIASEEFSQTFAQSLVTLTGICSLLNSFYYGDRNGFLMLTMFTGNLMGTVYSVELPFLHWKRFPALAASLIFMVRGGLIQVGFFSYTITVISEILGKGMTNMGLKSFLGIDSFQISREDRMEIWFENDYISFLVWFLTIFGVAIAFFKDIPDIAGDEANGIRTFAVRFGARKMVNTVNFLLGFVYSLAALYWQQKGSFMGSAGHILVYLWLGNVLNNTVVKGNEAAKSIRKSYMSIWKAFYVEYIVIFALFAFEKSLISLSFEA